MRRALALCALAALTGCYSIRYHTRAAPESEPRYDKWHHDVIFGLVEASKPVPVSEICPDGFAVVENQVTFANRLLNLITFYAPWYPSNVEVTCAKAGSQAAGSERARHTTKIAVLKLVGKTGVDPANADVLTDALVGELRKHAGTSVVSPSEIGALLGFERNKQLLGCTESNCLAEIAGAMGVDRLVTGSLGRIGNSLVVSLSSLDARKAQPAATVYETLKRGSDEDFLDALPKFVNRLLDEPGAAGKQ